MNEFPADWESDEPKSTDNISIYRVSEDDWFAARSAAEARGAAHRFFGQDDFLEPLPDVRKISERDLDRLIFSDDLDDPRSRKRTFRQELKRRIEKHETFPCHFASQLC